MNWRRELGPLRSCIPEVGEPFLEKDTLDEGCRTNIEYAGSSTRDVRFVMGPALFREDARRTGSVTESSCSIAEPGLRWCVSTQGAIRSSPLLVGERVYFASTDKRVYAVDRASGDSVWTTSLGFSALGSPVQTDELLMISGEGGIAALRQTDGTNPGLDNR